MTDPNEMGTATAESLRAADACAPGVASVAPSETKLPRRRLIDSLVIKSTAPRLPRLSRTWQYRHLMVPKGRRGPRPVAVEPEPGVPRVPSWLANASLCAGVFVLTWSLSGSLRNAWSRHQRREVELTEAVRYATDCAVHQARLFDDRLQAITDNLRVLDADMRVLEARMQADRARGWRPLDRERVRGKHHGR